MKWTRHGHTIAIAISACAMAMALSGCSIAGASNQETTTNQQDVSDLKTARAQRGDLTISAMGVGTVISDDSVDLAFETAGELVQLNVQVGDQVAAGTVLAQIDDGNALDALASAQADLMAAEQTLIRAEISHEELVEEPTEAEILAAQALVAAAAQALVDLEEGSSEADILAADYALSAAIEKRNDLVDGPDSTTSQDAQDAVDRARNSLWAAQISRDAKGNDKDKESGAYDQAQSAVLNAELELQQVLRAQTELLDEPTQVEMDECVAAISAAQERLDDLLDGPTEAELIQTQSSLASAQEALEELLEPASDREIALSVSSVAQAELSLSQAQEALIDAQEAVASTTITATIDGTVMTLRYDEGDDVWANDAIVSLADLSEPHLTVYIDELDMDMLQVGYEVSVLFDALPDQLFTGHVTQVSPELSSAGGLSLVQGTVVLDADSFNKSLTLPPGLNATVDVIGGQTENAVLVPVEAVRQVGEDSYAVFVMQNGTPWLQFVEVGLQNYTTAEILDGLDGNEIVTTGIVEVQ